LSYGPARLCAEPAPLLVATNQLNSCGAAAQRTCNSYLRSLVSVCSVCFPHDRQNFFNLSLSGFDRRFLAIT